MIKKTNIFTTVLILFAFALLISEASAKKHHAQTSEYQIGQRVVISEKDRPKATVVDRNTWKLATLHVSQPSKSKEKDEYTIKVLVPPQWLQTHNVRVGSMVPIPLDLEGMDFDKSLRAKVVGIDPCPSIQSGSGRVVISTVKHFSRNVYELTCKTADGSMKTIKQDASYRFTSADRSDWVPIKDLRNREKIRWIGNMPLIVDSVRPLSKAEDVYALTVEPDQLHYVGLHHELAPSVQKPHSQPQQQHHSATVKHAEIPKEVWTPGISGNRLQNASDHWKKHRSDFPNLKNEKEYIQYAYDFVQSAPMKKKRSNGDTVCFDPKSGTFAIVDKHGIMRTCFKPSGGLSYYQRQ